MASAGSQRGRDGQSAHDGGAIVFEAKRYDESIPKDKIFTKILEIAAEKSNAIELYIVAATCAISAQHITTLKDGARRLSVVLLVLDWPETGLAELATLVAMAPKASAQFIAKHTTVSEK